MPDSVAQHRANDRHSPNTPTPQKRVQKLKGLGRRLDHWGEGIRHMRVHWGLVGEVSEGVTVTDSAPVCAHISLSPTAGAPRPGSGFIEGKKGLRDGLMGLEGSLREQLGERGKEKEKERGAVEGMEVGRDESFKVRTGTTENVKKSTSILGKTSSVFSPVVSRTGNSQEYQRKNSIP